MDYANKWFTIHFATINTASPVTVCDFVSHLQYTLLLLIPIYGGKSPEERKDLQYTLLLLILNSPVLVTTS